MATMKCLPRYDGFMATYALGTYNVPLSVLGVLEPEVP